MNQCKEHRCVPAACCSNIALKIQNHPMKNEWIELVGGRMPGSMQELQIAMKLPGNRHDFGNVLVFMVGSPGNQDSYLMAHISGMCPRYDFDNQECRDYGKAIRPPACDNLVFAGEYCAKARKLVGLERIHIQ